MNVSEALIICLVVGVSLLLFIGMYRDLREEDNRNLKQEIKRLQEMVKDLEKDNRILRGRLGEQPSRAEY